jgi:hypothetical protein
MKPAMMFFVLFLGSLIILTVAMLVGWLIQLPKDVFGKK